MTPAPVPAAPPERRRLAVGSSAATRAREAGADAVRPALTADDPRLVVLFNGEIARTHGVGGFPNQTLVVLALA